MEQIKLRMHDIATVVAWHHNMSVTDDQAYVSLLRILKFVEYAIAVLEEIPRPDEPEEK